MTRQVKTYNPNHIFVDTNVLIGAYSGDTRFQTDSVVCITSTLSWANGSTPQRSVWRS